MHDGARGTRRCWRSSKQRLEGSLCGVFFDEALVVRGGAPKGNDAVQFYKADFGAEEVIRVNHPKRKAEQELPLILAAELKLGSCTFIVSDLTDEGSSLYVDKFTFTCSSSLFVHKTPYAFTLGYITLVHIIFLGPARLHDILCDICICVLVL